MTSISVGRCKPARGAALTEVTCCLKLGQRKCYSWHVFASRQLLFRRLHTRWPKNGYLVRNSIFHGSKPLGKTYDEDQKRRLEVYDLFLKCITSLFFLVAGRKPVASDCVQLPISGMALSNTHPSNTILDQGSVLEAVNLGLMKVGDSRLIPEFSRSIPPPDIPPVEPIF